MHVYLKALVALVLTTAPQISKADMNIGNQHFLADKSYANEIEVKAYIITREQACAALRDPPQEPVQLEKKELIGKKKLLFLRVTNKGEKRAWGTLACTVPSYHVPIKVPIFDLDNLHGYNTYILHLGLLGFLQTEKAPPTDLCGVG